MNLSKQPVILWDLDGVLAKEQDVLNWEDKATCNAAFKAMEPNHLAIGLLHSLVPRTAAAVIITSRPACFIGETKLWLYQHNIYPVEIATRADNDLRPSAEVKRSWLPALRAMYHIAFAIDNDPAVISMYRDEGIPSFLYVDNATQLIEHRRVKLTGADV